jgi:hypothetical protein
MQVNDPLTGMPTPEAMQRGQGVANLATTGGIPMAQRGAAGMAGGKLGSPEHITGAAVTATNGRIFSAPNHFLAMEKAAKELGVPMKDIYGYLEPDVGRFITNQGRMLDRAEAGKLLTGKDERPIFAEELGAAKPQRLYEE